nr:oxidized low-density lipoprotein receptor 1 [Onthophagus taurus]
MFLIFVLISTILPQICITSNDTNEIVNQDGIWGPILEDLATKPISYREKRVMRIIPVGNAFVPSTLTDRISDGSPSITIQDDKESKISPGKVLSGSNHPTKLKPTSNSGRQVSETDLYLLGAIEKLVFRMDFMEKRLRKLEQMLYYVMAGSRIDKEPCLENYTRVGSSCYLFHANAGREMDWKAASSYCKKHGSTLAEMETIEENQDIVGFIQSTPNLRGKDFWTGGLNPGLLWIWSNSARPVSTATSGNKKNPSAQEIIGDGRCLRLAYDTALRSYNYKGSDCSVRYGFICEVIDNTGSNEISRIGRSKNILLDEL